MMATREYPPLREAAHWGTPPEASGMTDQHSHHCVAAVPHPNGRQLLPGIGGGDFQEGHRPYRSESASSTGSFHGNGGRAAMPACPSSWSRKPRSHSHGDEDAAVPPASSGGDVLRSTEEEETARRAANRAAARQLTSPLVKYRQFQEPTQKPQEQSIVPSFKPKREKTLLVAPLAASSVPHSSELPMRHQPKQQQQQQRRQHQDEEHPSPDRPRQHSGDANWLELLNAIDVEWKKGAKGDGRALKRDGATAELHAARSGGNRQAKHAKLSSGGTPVPSSSISAHDAYGDGDMLPAQPPGRRGPRGQSRYKGVCITRAGKWRAVIYIGRKQKYLGVFDREEDAAIAYDRSALSFFGKGAKLNFPRPVPLFPASPIGDGSPSAASSTSSCAAQVGCATPHIGLASLPVHTA